MVFVTTNQIMLTAILMVVIADHQQQLEDATQDGLVITTVMISITIWAAAMMEGIVVDVTLTPNTAQSAHALTQMELGLEQLAHQLQPCQLCHQLMIQVLCISFKLLFLK